MKSDGDTVKGVWLAGLLRSNPATEMSRAAIAPQGSTRGWPCWELCHSLRAARDVDEDLGLRHARGNLVIRQLLGQAARRSG